MCCENKHWVNTQTCARFFEFFSRNIPRSRRGDYTLSTHGSRMLRNTVTMHVCPESRRPTCTCVSIFCSIQSTTFRNTDEMSVIVLFRTLRPYDLTDPVEMLNKTFMAPRKGVPRLPRSRVDNTYCTVSRSEQNENTIVYNDCMYYSHNERLKIRKD